MKMNQAGVGVGDAQVRVVVGAGDDDAAAAAATVGGECVRDEMIERRDNSNRCCSSNQEIGTAVVVVAAAGRDGFQAVVSDSVVATAPVPATEIVVTGRILLAPSGNLVMTNDGMLDLVSDVAGYMEDDSRSRSENGIGAIGGGMTRTGEDNTERSRRHLEDVDLIDWEAPTPTPSQSEREREHRLLFQELGLMDSDVVTEEASGKEGRRIHEETDSLVSPVLSGQNSPIAQKLDAEAGEYQVKNDSKKEKKEISRAQKVPAGADSRDARVIAKQSQSGFLSPSKSPGHANVQSTLTSGRGRLSQPAPPLQFATVESHQRDFPPTSHWSVVQENFMLGREKRQDQEEEEFGGLEGQNMIGNQVADGPGDDISEDDDDDDDD
ncbi:unnamed protein product [Sphagnum tenellum]